MRGVTRSHSASGLARGRQDQPARTAPGIRCQLGELEDVTELRLAQLALPDRSRIGIGERDDPIFDRLTGQPLPDLLDDPLGSVGSALQPCASASLRFAPRPRARCRACPASARASPTDRRTSSPASPVRTSTRSRAPPALPRRRPTVRPIIRSLRPTARLRFRTRRAPCPTEPRPGRLRARAASSRRAQAQHPRANARPLRPRSSRSASLGQPSLPPRGLDQDPRDLLNDLGPQPHELAHRRLVRHRRSHRHRRNAADEASPRPPNQRLVAPPRPLLNDHQPHKHRHRDRRTAPATRRRIPPLSDRLQQPRIAQQHIQPRQIPGSSRTPIGAPHQTTTPPAHRPTATSRHLLENRPLAGEIVDQRPDGPRLFPGQIATRILR